MRLFLTFVALLTATISHAETTAITNAHVMDGTQDTQGVTIVIDDGTISSVATGAPAPAGARIIDAAGRPVTLSLNAAATQIGIVGLGGEDSTVSSGPLSAAFDVSRAVDPNALTIQEARAQGVARAMIFPSAGQSVFSGTGTILHLAPGKDPLEKPAAAMFAVPAADKAGGSRGAAWVSIRHALDAARSIGKTGDTPRDDALGPLNIAALRPVVDGRMPLAIMANRESDIRQSIALSRDYAIRVVVVGGAEAWRVARELASSRTAVVLDPLDDLPFTYDAVASRRNNAAILARNGVTISFMVSGQTVYLSYNVATALREGAGLAVANGLPRAEALRAITTAPSLIWTGKVQSGLVPGTVADLVIWDGDPLEPSSAPDLVFIAGKEISTVTHRTRLRDRYHPSRMNDALPPAYR